MTNQKAAKPTSKPPIPWMVHHNQPSQTNLGTHSGTESSVWAKSDSLGWLPLNMSMATTSSETRTT